MSLLPKNDIEKARVILWITGFVVTTFVTCASVFVTYKDIPFKVDANAKAILEVKEQFRALVENIRGERFMDREILIRIDERLKRIEEGSKNGK